MRKWLLVACSLLIVGILYSTKDKVSANLAEGVPVGSALGITLPEAQITLNQVIASGFSAPIQVTNAGDGTHRLFVVEQTGKIRIVKNGSVLSTPFLDLTGLIVCCGERGLLGLAFHPNYASNGYLYVDYTRASDGATVIARYRVSASNANQVDPASALVLFTISQPYTNHNGGQLLFSPVDGYLYIGMGDGGGSGDAQNRAQNTGSLLGKILRLDVDHGSPYAIPPDNPLVGLPGNDEIWALGLRNPWRFSFDRLNGDLYIGDVGQNLWEEIDFQAENTPGGKNFGWRCREGAHNFNFSGSCSSLTLVDPIAEFSHSVGYSVTGGFVYRGEDYPNLTGRYFYADYVTGQIWSLYKTSESPLIWSTPTLELDTSFNISSFGEDENGEIYVVNYNQGQIRLLADVAGPVPDLSTSKKMVSSPSADPQEVVTYTIHISNTRSLYNSPVYVSDEIPGGLTYVPDSFKASHGSGNVNGSTLSWQGNLNTSLHIELTYQVSVTGNITGSIVNQANLLMPPSTSIPLPAAVSVPRSVLTTTVEDFFFPGTQPGHLAAGIAPSADCDTCHSAPVYDRWRGSVMSQAGRDPLFWSALYVANIDAPNAGEYCLRCHTPKGWLEGRSQPSDGTRLVGEDVRYGVACAICHRTVDPLPAPSDETAAIDASIRSALTDPVPATLVGSGAMIFDPNDNRRGPFSFSPPLAYHTAFRTGFLGQNGEAETHARLCGSCHNVYNPVLSWDTDRQQFWLNPSEAGAPSFAQDQLFPVETTYDEWLNSDFAKGGVFVRHYQSYKPGGVVETCQDCHMPRTTGGAVDEAFNPVSRDCQTTGCLPVHSFIGGNTWLPQLLQNPAWRLNAAGESAYLEETIGQTQLMLERAAFMTITLTDSGANKVATVRVTNLSGHKLPTGYAEGRQMWINLKAYDADDQMLQEYGAYNLLTGQLTYDTKVYEVKQGLTTELAEVLHKVGGESFHFVLYNTVVKDNRIPPYGFTQAAYDRPGLRPVGVTYDDYQNWDDTEFVLPGEVARVEVLLYYQTASKEYVDFLRANGGVDGLALGQLWEVLKSTPQIVARAYYPSYPVFFPMIAR